jgi:hypothetical protein|tara:strand:+ start:48 stop:407 length:360 start_codon:yes stop_codon:yes gene_type:complete
MTNKHFKELTKVIIDKISKARDAGQEEYAHDQADVFANFNRVSSTLGVKREKVLLTYLLKHIDGIVSYVNGHESQREDVTGRITDVIVYSMLLWGMVQEKKFREDSVVTYQFESTGKEV